MEALVLIVLSYLAQLFWPVLVVFGAAVSALAELVFELIRVLLGRKADRRSTPQGTIPKTTESSEAGALAKAALRRRLVGFIGLPVAIAIVPVIVTNLFFFEPAARWATDRVASQTGMTIKYAEIEGDLFTGRLAITGLSVRKPAGTGAEIDLSVQTAQIDVNLLTVLAGEGHVEELIIEGVTGRVAASAPATSADASGHTNKQRRAFAVSNLRIADVAIDVAPIDRPSVQLKIMDASSQHFRSRYAAFDFFFRSNLDARIDGVPLSVKTEAVSDQSLRTTWRLDKAPVGPIGDLINRAPATWFQDGTLSIEVDDFWDLEDLTVDMDWRLFLDGARIAAPEGAGLRERAMAGALNKFVERRPDGVELAFQLYLDENSFEASGSRDLTALWDALLPALQTMLESKGISIGQSDDLTVDQDTDGPTLSDRVKSASERIGNIWNNEPDE